jgi:hypothetical protein
VRQGTTSVVPKEQEGCWASAPVFHLLAIAQRLKPGSKLVICGTTEQAAEKGMVSG